MGVGFKIMFKAELHICILRAIVSKENLAWNFEKILILLNSLHSDSKRILTDFLKILLRFSSTYSKHSEYKHVILEHHFKT